jgi:hypothetical protein
MILPGTGSGYRSGGSAIVDDSLRCDDVLRIVLERSVPCRLQRAAFADRLDIETQADDKNFYVWLRTRLAPTNGTEKSLTIGVGIVIAHNPLHGRSLRIFVASVTSVTRIGDRRRFGVLVRTGPVFRRS